VSRTLRTCELWRTWEPRRTCELLRILTASADRLCDRHSPVARQLAGPWPSRSSSSHPAGQEREVVLGDIDRATTIVDGGQEQPEQARDPPPACGTPRRSNAGTLARA
jgi:hypothetical protein